MLFGSIRDVPSSDVGSTIRGTRGFRIQWLITKENGSSKYAVRRFTVEPGGRMPLHKHKYTEAVVILRGALRVRINEEERVLGPGDFFFTGPGEPHSIENAGRDEAEFICTISYEDDMSITVLE
ncbi:cupin [Thermocladium modestius]|uniref:Cupin n=1 Tax=Thermocladium modestius TaxID=62609 RepID=A0A830GRP1_9CREN|nr:cupin domain-containing protein [Thermocladium modestius]GGP19139.1 cupin [Thermocladium modestius]